MQLYCNYTSGHLIPTSFIYVSTSIAADIHPLFHCFFISIILSYSNEQYLNFHTLVYCLFMTCY